MTTLQDPELQHIVGVYDEESDLVSAVATFLAPALHDDGEAVVIATPEHRAAFDAALISEGLSPHSLRRAGRYRSPDAAATLAQFMNGPTPDRRRFESAIGSIFEEIACTGGPVRLFGEMVGLLWDEGNLSGALELESLWNDLAAHHAFELFCAYATSSLETSGDLAAAKQMCDRHSSVVAMQASRGPASDLASAPPSYSYDRVFVGSPASLRGVREFLRDALRVWGYAEINGDAELIASELATNAVNHARSPFRVTISRAAGRSIRIAVRDASFERPHRGVRNTARLGGRGVELVAALSRAWGTEEEPDGKTVWAEVSAGRRVEPV